ncbi:LCP family protein [Ktedonobacteria bacterium brp13]|nr:LCP family protein [Ktedonobacteria bacterium brp13]
MSNKFNFYTPDAGDAGQGMPPYPPQPASQGKLVLGRNGAQQQPTYQGNPGHPQAPHAPQQPPRPQQPPHQPYQPQTPPNYQGRVNNQAYTPPGHQPQGPHVPQGPGPQGPQAPYKQVGTFSSKPKRRTTRKQRRQIGCLATIVIVVVVVIFAFNTISRVLGFGTAISTQPPLSTQTGYMTTSNRTNLLVLGYGGSGHDGAYLTDSIMVISMIPSTQHTSLVSVPRDLWVTNPPGSSNYSKINAIYPDASNNNQNPVQGGDAMAQKISVVTGLDVKNWMTINFTGFRDLINSIGGVDIYVQNSFTANYPANDDPSINAAWKTISFTKGQQHMDGETAIEYARAREVTGGDMAEGTDFARSIRQQIIVKAALAKIKSISSWPYLYSAMDALQKAIYTNMSLADLGLFSTKMNLNDPHTARIGLSTANVMAFSTSSDGQSIVIPQNDDFSIIPPYVKSKLYQ